MGARDVLPPALDAVRIGQPILGPAQLVLGVLEAIFNGLVTNDKFCLSRPARLHLSHWHRPLCQRLSDAVPRVYPAHHYGGVGGCTDEAPPVADPSPVRGNARR